MAMFEIEAPPAPHAPHAPHALLAGDPAHLMYIEDIQAVFGTFPPGHARAGEWRKSRDWIVSHLPVDGRILDGHTYAWPRRVVNDWWLAFCTAGATRKRPSGRKPRRGGNA